MAARNLIADVGMVQIASSTYWNKNSGLTATLDGGSTRRVSVSATGSPAGQERRLYGPWDYDTVDHNQEGRYVVARVRAMTDADDGYGGWDPSGEPGRLGIAFWDHPGENAQGLVTDIPFGIRGGGTIYPDRPEWHDVEIIHQIEPGDVGYRVLWKIEVLRGNRRVLIDCPSAELYIVDSLDELGGGGGGVPAEPPEDDPPTAPQSVTVTETGPSRVGLSWDAGTDDVAVVGYNVYRLDDTEPVRVNPVLVQALTFLVTGLEPWTDYTFTVRAVDTAGQESDDSEPVNVRTDLPDPELDGDPWELFGGLADALAPRVAAYVGRAMDPETTAAAAGYVPVVAEYVRGYTRGRGFKANGQPVGPIMAVIVSAAARLVANPEQVTYYSTGDYTERPATLSGWTLAELAVLRRYRRVSA